MVVITYLLIQPLFGCSSIGILPPMFYNLAITAPEYAINAIQTRSRVPISLSFQWKEMILVRLDLS
jgi:hypothetical protein